MRGSVRQTSRVFPASFVKLSFSKTVIFFLNLSISLETMWFRLCNRYRQFWSYSAHMGYVMGQGEGAFLSRSDLTRAIHGDSSEECWGLIWIFSPAMQGNIHHEWYCSLLSETISWSLWISEKLINGIVHLCGTHSNNQPSGTLALVTS